MAFGHEKLDGYSAAIEYVGWAYYTSAKVSTLSQVLVASLSLSALIILPAVFVPTLQRGNASQAAPAARDVPTL